MAALPSAPADVQKIAQEMEVKTGGSASTWTAIIMRESGGNANAVNPSSGAIGLFQLYPNPYGAGGASVETQMNDAAAKYAASGFRPWGY